MSELFFVGDSGLVLLYQLVKPNGQALPIDDATTKELVFDRPDKSSFAQPVVFATDGTDGVVKYVTQSTDFDVAGKWTLQVHVVTPTFDVHSEVDFIKVFDPLL